MRKDRASPKCAMLLVAFGFLIVVLQLAYFISTMFQAMFIVEELKVFFGGAVMLILGLMIFRCNIRKGAFDPKRRREIERERYESL